MESPPPAPGGYPVIGQTLSVLRAPFDSLERWGRTDEPIVRVTIAGMQCCLVTAPDAIERVLVTDRADYRKADIVRDRLDTLQGGSLVLLEGDHWRERRDMLGPAFGRDRVAAIDSLTTEYTREMVTAWPTDVRIVDRIRTLVLALLADALFGLEFSGEESPIHEAAADILARMDLRSISTYLPEWVPTPTNIRFRRAVSTLHDRLDERLTSADGTSETLLSTMLAAGLPPEVVRNELIALLFAGYDSTATALSCTLALLGDHPATQSALATELETVLGGQPPTAADLSELPVLDAVINEALRLYPPQYLLFREPSSVVQLQGYRIEPGTTIVLPPWLVHRNERFWDDPAAFRPDRWLDESTGTDRPTYAYFPYGGGPRHCLGAGLAAQTLRLVTAVLCQHRRFELVGSLDVAAGPTLSIGEDLLCRTEPRRSNRWPPDGVT